MALSLWSIAIFVLTLTLVIWKPRGLGIEFSAALGAILALAIGVVTWQDILEVWGIVWNATFTLMALVIISLIANEAGFFRWLALYIACLGMGRGWLLFLLVVLLGAVVTALLTNYGSILILTPTAIEVLLVLGFSPKATLAFAIALGFIADAASLPLPVSNLVNIITTDFFNISFLRYTLVMVPTNFVAVVTSLGVLWFYFDRFIPPTYNFRRLIPSSKGVIRDRLVFRCSFVILGLLPIACLLAQPLSIPICAIALFGAFVMLALAGRWFHRHAERAIDLNKVLREVPWQVILFTVGMHVVAIGATRNTNITALSSHFLENLSRWGIAQATVGTGFLAAMLSSVTNNVPAVLINAIAIRDSDGIDPTVREAMVYANAIGCNLGAKITPIGSLSTLLWLNILERKGFRLNLGQYVRVTLVLTLPVLFVTLLFLAVWLPWLIA